MNRRERRALDSHVQAKKAEVVKAASGGLLGDAISIGGYGNNRGGGGGWGLGDKGAKPAGGTYPTVNPVMQPKPAGLTLTSQTYPSNYYVEWNLSTWRYAIDQCVKMGLPWSLATMYSWVFECSPFVQSMFTALSTPLDATKFFVVNEAGDILPDWTDELCNKSWHKELRREILFAKFWGFSGINFDPIWGKVFKYPMQDIDPINQMLREGTYTPYSGTRFADAPNTMYVQPSQANERFCGWMEPISRSFIMMNKNKTSWLQAGLKLAFPLMTVGYPQDDQAVDPNDPTKSINPYKLQAESVIANADPSRGLAYPYTIDEKGNIVKSLEVDFAQTGTGAKAHDIFTDFNDAEKNEIREMILGGTLTADVGNSGSRALGEVQERKFDTMNASNIEFVETELNSQWLDKMRILYVNMPQGIKIITQQSKPMTLADMQALSGVVTQNGKRLTTAFFTEQGIPEEFIEDAPEPIPMSAAPSKPGQDKNVKPGKKDYNMAEKDFSMAEARYTIVEKLFAGMGVKKKYR